MDYLMLWGAMIAALATVAVAVVQSITLYKIGQMQAHADVQTVATVKVQSDVNRIEVNTNSISKRLEDLARAQGILVGRAQVEAEIALRDKNVAVGRKQEQDHPAGKELGK